MAKKKQDTLLELGVVYGNLSVGDETARLAVSVERKRLKLTEADRFLCSKRITASITSTAGNDNPDQPSLMDVGEEIVAVWDTHSFGVNLKRISFGLTCKIGSIDITKLTHFAKRAGVVKILDIGDIPEEESKED